MEYQKRLEVVKGAARGGSIAYVVALVLAGSALPAQQAGPTKQQRDHLRSFKGSIEIVQFLAVKDRDALGVYLGAAERIVREAGGTQKHVLGIDQVLSGLEDSETPYSVITIDQFPDSDQMLRTFDGLAEERSAALSDLYALILKPDPQILWVKRLKFLAPLLRLRFRIGEIGEFNEDVQLLQPERNATAEAIQAFQSFDQQEPFYNMNLNKFYPVPAGEKVSTEEYYAEFSKQTARVAGARVLSIGAYPTVAGRIIEIFTGDKQQPLHDDWDNFQIIYYPKREDYLRLITNLPIEIVEKRNKAYERSIQMPCTPLSK